MESEVCGNTLGDVYPRPYAHNAHTGWVWWNRQGAHATQDGGHLLKLRVLWGYAICRCAFHDAQTSFSFDQQDDFNF